MKKPPGSIRGASSSAPAPGARRQRLAGHRPARRRRTGRRTFTAGHAGHVHDRRARQTAQRDQRSTSRNGNGQWGARRQQAPARRREKEVRRESERRPEWEHRRGVGPPRAHPPCPRSGRRRAHNRHRQPRSTGAGTAGGTRQLPARRLRLPIRTCTRRRPFSMESLLQPGSARSRHRIVQRQQQL